MPLPAAAASTTAAAIHGVRGLARCSTLRLTPAHDHLERSALVAAFFDMPRPSSSTFSVTGDRLAEAADGRVVLRLRHPWTDGTTHVAFEPTALLQRLAVLVPRPRINLLLYHGVLAAHAAWRAEVIPQSPPGAASPTGCARSDHAPSPPAGPAGRRWADLMRRAFEVDVLACPRCGGRLRLIALLEAGLVTARILRHVGLPSDVPPARPALAPPLASRDESW